MWKLVPWMSREVSVILVVTFAVTPVGFSMYVPAVPSCVLVVTDVSVSPSWVGVLVSFPCQILVLSLWHRSPFLPLSLESVKLFVYGRYARKNAASFQNKNSGMRT